MGLSSVGAKLSCPKIMVGARSDIQFEVRVTGELSTGPGLRVPAYNYMLRKVLCLSSSRDLKFLSDAASKLKTFHIVVNENGS